MSRPSFGCGTDTRGISWCCERVRGEEVPCVSALKAMSRGQGVRFWLQNGSHGSEPTPELILLAIPSSRLPLCLKEWLFLHVERRGRAAVSETRA